MRAGKVTPIFLCQPRVSTLCEERVMDAQRHRIGCPLIRISSPGRISERIKARDHAAFEIGQSPPRLAAVPAEWHINFGRFLQRHEHPLAARVLHVIPTLFRSGKRERITTHCCVMPTRNIENKIKRGGRVFGKRNRESIRCPFPKHCCRKRSWSRVDAVWSDTKARAHLLPPFQWDALIYNGQGSVRGGEGDSHDVVFNGRHVIAVLPIGETTSCES